MCNSYFNIRTYCVLAFAACCILSASPAVAQTYFNDFEGAVGSEWSNTSTATTPVGARTFLGQFDNQTVSLTLASVPACNVTVSFDLFIIQSWDGHADSGGYGPDVWELSVGGGPTLLYTTFATHEPRKQAYPDTYPGGLDLEPIHPHNTGADEIGTLGYLFTEDAVYNLSFTFLHAGGGLVLNFSAAGLQGIGDESWGLDNVLVNCPPDCSNAVPSVDTIWPPNHEFVCVDVLDVTDPDGDAVTITIDRICQDEPVDATGDGAFAPDGVPVATEENQNPSIACVRAERDGAGNGRVYHIWFTADDGNGGTCSSKVLVSVPKSQGKNGAAVDDGPLYDSTIF